MKQINEKNILELALNEAALALTHAHNANKTLTVRFEEALKSDSDCPGIRSKIHLQDAEQLKLALANAMTHVQYTFPVISGCGGLVVRGDEYLFIRKMFPSYPKSLQILLAHDLSLRNKQIGYEYVKMPFADFVDVFSSEVIE